MKKEWWGKFAGAFLSVFLLGFMVFIFGPAEIFFANANQFEFVYMDFAGYLAVAAFGIAAVLAVVFAFMPTIVYNILTGGFVGLSVAAYVQVMFLNKDLDLLGENPEGYWLDKSDALINIGIWFLIIAAFIALSVYKKAIWRKVSVYCSAFLIAIQAVALLSLVLTAEEGAFNRRSDEWYLDGRNQYTVSADENVIVILLDYYSNQYLEPALDKYPDLVDFMNDFTYYNNADCNYFGTFPSIVRTLTGYEIDPSIKINDWFYDAWTNPDTLAFYEDLKANNYKINFYTESLNHIIGMNDAELLSGVFSNMSNEPRTVDVYNRILLEVITKMSCYRMAPVLFKQSFYTLSYEYQGIVSYCDADIEHCNYDFYWDLMDNDLSVDDSANYFIVQHLEGPHAYTTGPDGLYKSGATREETIKGCMVLLKEYFKQLKELGLYDSSTIIVTSDHGGPEAPQVIMYIKEKGETHDEMQVSDAPISLAELRATVMEYAGLDSAPYGPTFHDFDAGELRERVVWIRRGIGKYDSVYTYTGDRIGVDNVYYGYRYTGSFKELKEHMDKGPDEVQMMLESFY